MARRSPITDGPIRIASNPWPENAALNIVLERQGYLADAGVEARIVTAEGVAGPFDAILSGKADVCMVSAYNGVLPRIARGAPIRIVGAGMRKTALALYARPGRVAVLADLAGCRVAVGPPGGLLHMLMLGLLASAGIDADRVTFHNAGSNAQCHAAVLRDEADACCAGVAHLGAQGGLAQVPGGNLWEALPAHTFQTAYASVAALRDRHADLVAVMTAFGRLYDFLMSPGSREAYVEARRDAAVAAPVAAAEAVWSFFQTQRPYSRDLSLTDNDIDRLQDMSIRVGGLARRHPVDCFADMSAARAAACRTEP